METYNTPELVIIGMFAAGCLWQFVVIAIRIIKESREKREKKLWQ